MILINLLPYREARREARKRAYFAGLGLSAVAGAALVGLGWLMLQSLISNQQDRNRYLEQENARLDEQIKDIAELKAEIEALTRRQQAVEALQGERNLPVHMLNELARLAPEGVYFTTLKQSDKSVELVGLAQTQERISEFMRNTSRDAQWLQAPKLNEIKLAPVSTNTREAKRLFEFTMKLSIKSLAPADEASAPKKG